MKLMEFAELVSEMREDEIYNFVYVAEDKAEWHKEWFGECGIQKINAFDACCNVYLIGYWGENGNVELYKLNDYDGRIEDALVERCGKMLSDFAEKYGEDVTEITITGKFL